MKKGKIKNEINIIQDKTQNPVEIYLFGREEQKYLNDIEQLDSERQKYVN